MEAQISRYSDSTTGLEWGAAVRPLKGESECGDRFLVKPFPGGLLAAGIDGLGHGPEAAQAARTVQECLEEYASEPLPGLLKRCHEMARRTRGAAVSAARYLHSSRELQWTGVGNVEGVWYRKEEGASKPVSKRLLVRSGTIGGEIFSVEPVSFPVREGDVLILTSDGIRHAFAEGIDPIGLPPQETAERLLKEFARGTDDALVLVLRWVSPARKEQSDD